MPVQPAGTGAGGPGLESLIPAPPVTGGMSSQAGSSCPECGGQLETDDGMTYVCRDCGASFDSADVFFL